MPTMLTETAIAAMKTALEAIGDGSTTWAATRRPLVTRDPPHGKALPAEDLIFIRHDETSAWHCSRGDSALYQTTVRVYVYWFFNAPTWNPDTDHQSIAHDIYKALRDHTLAGTVDLLEVVGVFPHVPGEGEDPACKMRGEVTLTYRFDKNDPSVRA